MLARKICSVERCVCSWRCRSSKSPARNSILNERDQQLVNYIEAGNVVGRSGDKKSWLDKGSSDYLNTCLTI